jgi:hypothetical protein
MGPPASVAMLALQRAVGNRGVSRALRRTAIALPAVHDVLATPGRALGPPARERMEQRFGQDLRDVRVHADDTGAAAAEAVDALAFTVGAHVVFGRGRYRPETRAGRELLAHELAHTLQQRSARPTPERLVVAPDDGPHEVAARRQAAAALADRALPTTVACPPTIARQAAPAKPKKGTTSKPADLEKRFGIKVEKGDKAWSENDLFDLEWALGKLDKSEQAVVKGYRFLRWFSPESREAADESYVRRGEDECGLHEPDLSTGTFKISMYDDCFYDIQKSIGDKPVATTAADPRSGGAIEILHEIGHAMALREERVLFERSERARKALNDHAAKYSGVSLPTARLEQVKREHDQLTAASDEAERAWRASHERAQATAAAIHRTPRKGGKPKGDITEYAKKNDAELFAEAYKLFKSQPGRLEEVDPELAEWLRTKSFLNTVAQPTETQQAPQRKPRP